MPPAERTNTVTTVEADGRYRHRFRQSWLGTYMDCPERARRQAYGLEERVENDAACVGTALHGAIEDAIDVLMREDIMLGPADVADLWDEHWAQLNVAHDIAFVKRTPDRAVDYGRRAAQAWATHTLPFLTPHATEIPFGPFVIHEDDERIIEVTGTIDYVDAEWGLVDWKSASRKYERWEYERWAIQPTIYSWAWGHLNRFGHEPHENQWTGEPYQGPMGAWRYAVYVDKPTITPQYVDLERTAEYDWWIADQLVGIAEQLEATEEGHLSQWPKRDQHALCSPKWCPNWSDCKGMHLGSQGSPVAWVSKSAHS